MKTILVVLLFLINLSVSSQIRVVNHFDVNGVLYKIDTLENNLLKSSTFYSCNGNQINVFCDYWSVQLINISDSLNWQHKLKSEIEKRTKDDLVIFNIYGLVIDTFGKVLYIEKLSKNEYTCEIETTIVRFILCSDWKIFSRDDVKLNYYIEIPIKVNLIY